MSNFIERRIVTGLIVSTDYLQRIRKDWSSKMIQSKMAQKLSNWSIQFYDEFNKAPGEEIKSIFERKRKSMSPEEQDDIEDVLSSLSDDFEREDKFNVSYLVKQTIEYFKERNLSELVDELTNKLEDGDVSEAEKILSGHIPVIKLAENALDLSSGETLEVVERAFKTAEQPLIKYTRQLGDFWNNQLMRGGFVALMAPEKRGKTFWLLDFAMKGVSQRANVAFFQAGDMSEEQFIIRASIYLAKKHNKERYCQEHFEPVRDCKLNQTDNCDLKARECNFGIFENKEERFIRREVTFSELVKAWNDNPDYKPCWNCKAYWKKPYGAVWLKKVEKTNPLEVVQAKKEFTKFFTRQSRRFKLSTHPNSTLTVTEIERTLDIWERQDGFVADVIIVDYIDIMASEMKGGDFRHQENDKWKRMRGLSQKKNVLVLSCTQTDAKSYEQDTLSLKNFSEDKRKFAHVTAMYGLNQDRKGREKDIGLMRINEIVIREDAYSSSNQVNVIQNLKRGRPCISSFW